MRLFILLLAFICSFDSIANPSQIVNMRLLERNEQSVRLIFEVNTSVIHNVFTLKDPYRLVIDFKNTTLACNVAKTPANHSFIKNLRAASRNDADVRVVLDLQIPVRAKSFSLDPADEYGHRLIVDIDILNRAAPVVATITHSSPVLQRHALTTSQQSPSSLPPRLPKEGNGRDLIIAIDAGHGGIDPGAVGQNGTKEKDAVLAISKELAALLSKEPGMYPVLIRNGDHFLKLRKRIDLAREYRADLFISIHADAYPDTTAQGSSIYMLSQQGASSEAARWLAERENSADLIGGINLSNKDDLLASVLLDLSQTSTLQASAHVAGHVLKALSKIGETHYSRVQQAAFVVLRSPDIPSILVETAFISSPADEQKLNDPQYRSRIANAILQGIRTYFVQYAPPDTLLAQR